MRHDDTSRPRLLYLVHRLPYPPDKGDRIRAYQLLRFLSRHAEVHLLCLADEPVEPSAVEALQGLCARLAVVKLGPMRWARALVSLAKGRTISEGAFSSAEVRQTVRQWTRDTPFDACLASASSMVPYLQMPELRDVPAVIDLVDVDSQKWTDYATASRAPRSWIYQTEGKRLQRLEATLPTWVGAVTLVTDAERDVYRRFASAGNVHVIPNGVDLDYFHPQPCAQEEGCVFLGALDYRPNVDGVVWFCNEVWPAIRQQKPDAVIRLVGRRPTLAVERLGHIAGVEVVGQVDDVRPYLAKAAVSVVPLRIARGVQNKVLESLSMGKATILSPTCLKGLKAQAGTDLLLASSPEEWQQTVIELLENPSLRSQLGEAGREYVIEHHRWERCLEPMRSLLAVQPSPTADKSPLFPKVDMSILVNT